MNKPSPQYVAALQRLQILAASPDKGPFLQHPVSRAWQVQPGIIFPTTLFVIQGQIHDRIR